MSLLSGSVWRADDPVPAANVQPLGGCVPGSEASAKGPIAAESAPVTKEWVIPGTGVTKSVTRDGVEAALAPEAVDRPTEIGVQPLSESTMPSLGSGMDNMTKGPRGYRFTPTPHTFETDITVSLPYDPDAVKAAGLTPDDVRTFYFDEAADCWQALERLSLDEDKHVVVSRTNHFTDMVNATVTAPEGPEQVSFDPNQIKGIQAADPSTRVNQIAAPAANNQGDARLSYPLELPGGRNGIAPSLAVSYSSTATDSWLGSGWEMTVPSLSVDTRWGVPRYAADKETESYLLGGEQLTPVAHRGEPQPRGQGDKVFHTRVEGGFARIVRTGDSPKTYGWEVTDKSGVRYVYGGEGAVLSDDNGDIFSWGLRELRDPHGNTVRYSYTLVEDAGVAGGTVAGREMYVRKIAYTGHGDTDGPYTVTFVRDRELDEPRRPDVSIDARGGFKRVTADLLRRVEVRFRDELVRGYELTYREGAFKKTLLKSVAQLDADGKVFTEHEFSYYDDIRDADGTYEAFARVDWSSPDDNVRNSRVNGVRSGAGEAGALNGNTSTGVGGHLYVGFGSNPTKNGSVGVKAGYNRSTDEGMLALTDVDGDNLPDKVFERGDGYVFRKNLSRPGGEPKFAGSTTALHNLPGIFRESASSRTVGVEAYLAGAQQLDHVSTVSTTRRYFADVNADGVVDLVNGSAVLFGRVGTDGEVTYGSAADTPAPIGTGPVDAQGVLPDLSEERERRIASFPLVDSVRAWTAPYDGTVAVTGTVALAEVAGELPDFADPDGVRVAVQHEDRELWSARVQKDDHTARTPEGVDAVEVKQGDQLYFRVGSVFDGAADQVTWNPTIAYTGFEATDANGLALHTYTASEDFTLAGRAGAVDAPATGTLRLTGDLKKTAGTTDDLTLLVTRDGDPVVERTIEATETGTFPLDTSVAVTKGQELSWQIRTDSPVDVTKLEWAPRAEYTEGVDGESAFSPPYDISTYTTGGTAQRTYTAPGGTLTVTPSVEGSGTGSAVVTVKKRGALLAKRTVRLGSEAPSFEVDAEAGEALYFDVTGAGVTGATMTVNGDADNPVAATVHTPGREGVFARPYRGWSAVGYNGNGDRAEQPIEQADLTGETIPGNLPEDVDPQRDLEEFEQDPRVTPPDVVPFTPDPERGRWFSGDVWVSAGTLTGSRYGGQTIGLPTAEALASVQAVPRISESQQISLTGSIGGGVGSLGGSVASGTSQGVLDYLDMNGDGYPDIVGAAGVQYTDPTGVPGTTKGSVPGGNVRESENVTGNASAGSAARTITTGRGHAAPPASGTANTSSSGNDMPPLGVGGNLGTGKSDAEFDLLDINGDGLPDRVHANGRAALNLGYSFAAPEPWPGGKLNEGTSSSAGVNIGFNTDFYGFAGGVSFDQTSSSTKNSLVDVNGDSRADRVLAGNPIRVALNTGSGFADPVPFNGSLNGINEDANARVGGGAYFTVSFCALFVTGCVITNPGANVSTGAARAEQMLRDIDGDGLADHLASAEDSELTVAANRTGRTNLLKSVARPLGSRIDLAYTRDGNTYDQPGTRWLLTGAKVHDGLPGDGPDTQSLAFAYEDGVHDRLEREFRGYGTVATTQDEQRVSTTEYDTGSHYTRGLVKRQTVADSSGALFTETRNTYALRDVATGEPADGGSTGATVFPQLVRTEARWYEGEAEPGKSTSSEMSYDELGNPTRTIDYGEPGAADDVETKTEYTACADTHIVGIARAEDVYGGGRKMRSSEAEVDCATGDVTRHTAKQIHGKEADADPEFSGKDSVTDLEYHDTGTLKSVKSPENHRGQRYQRTYEYDGPTGTYVTSTKDSFGYRSTASYDLRFGAQTESLDINEQKILTTYDPVGRVTSVTGPHDHKADRPTIAFAYHPGAAVPYAVTRHLDRDSGGKVKDDTIDTVTFVDGLGRVVQTKKDAEVAGKDVMTVSGRSVYDVLGRVVEQYYPVTEPKGDTNTTFDPDVDTVRPTTVAYDILDRPLRTRLPDQTVTTLEYGFAQDRADTVQFETVATDAKGNPTRSYTDVRQQKTAVREPGAKPDDAPIRTSYEYDPLGQLSKVEDNEKNTTKSEYDDLGRRTVIDSPDTGRTRTVHDPAGNAVRVITANLAEKHKAIEYKYDLNRLEEIKYPVFKDNNVRYTYGDPGAKHNTAGRIKKVEDAAGVETREYGPLGEVTEETRTVPGLLHDRTFTTGYRYDSFGRVLNLTYPDGEELAYTYDSGGQVTAATGTKKEYSYPYLESLDYDKFGERTRVELGNGTSTNYSYDAEDRRLATLNSTLPKGDAFQNLTYAYDDTGNLTRQENKPELAADSWESDGPAVQTYEYDNLHRLTKATGSYDVSKHKTDTYTASTAYDTIHNITGKAQRHALVVGGDHEFVQKDTSYTNGYAYKGRSPHAPSRVGSEKMSYDDNGNLTDSVSDPHGLTRRQQIWDEANRLACVHDTWKFETQDQDPSSCNKLGKPPTVRFLYDADGERVVKDGAQKSLYPNQNYSARGLQEFKHVFIGTTRIATKTAKPGWFYEKDQFYYHTDHLGSTTYGTDEKGRIAEHLDYFPSGEVWVDENKGEKAPYQFSGKELDEETGYTYHGARYYNSRTGLWQSPDPIIGDYLNGQGNNGVYNSANLNSYGYAYGNPVRNIDSDGNIVFIPAIILGAKLVGWGMTAYSAYQAGQTVYNTAQDVASGRKTVGEAATDAAPALAEAAADVALGKVKFVGKAGSYLADKAQDVYKRVAKQDGALDNATDSLAKAIPAGDCNSFVPGTEVVMADGSAKPVEDIETGDLVLATDPETDRTEGKPVTHLISGMGEKDLVEVTVDVDGDKGDRTASVTATGGHPFWIDELNRWLDAEDLGPGMRVSTGENTRAEVTAVTPWTARQQRVHNLTVGDVHTYYVLAAGTPVLVHNAKPCKNVVEGQAGRFGDLTPGPKGDNLTPHHMPQKALGHHSEMEGGALMMKQKDHNLTRSHSRAPQADEIVPPGATADEAHKLFRKSLGRDIWDARRIGKQEYGDSRYYTKGVQDLLAYYRGLGDL
ncbi:polymorphic toxin-type HINT domain-containing protein [Streptomyces phaeochromogenes]|uniref:SpvB/TcaC N-terminal domain-containing protein n=1 Tax=Streptomyces phaeochromogenes TaxID=1923 RepID=UPI00386781D5|nr:polymorphic toxin-type HINT domain-containing protein [Streptomyces phaeochromogenes]